MKSGIVRPYWRLADDSLPKGLFGTLARLKLSIQPVLEIVLSSAPRAAGIVFTAQALIAITVTTSLIIINDVLASLFDGNADFSSVEMAFPGLMMLALVFAIRLVTDFISALAKARLAPTVRRAAEEKLFQATLTVDLASYDDADFYDRLQRARDRGVLHLEGTIDALVDTLGAALAVIGAAVALFILHPAFIALMLLPLLPGAFGALAAARIQYEGMAETIALQRETALFGNLATQRTAAAEIRANQAQGHVLKHFSSAAGHVRDHIIGISIREAKVSGIANLLSGLGLATAFVVMALMIRASWIDIASAAAAVVAFRSAGSSLTQFVQRGNEMLEKALYISDFQQFLSLSEPKCKVRTGQVAPTKPAQIRVENLGFQYPISDEQWALQDVNFTINAGETIALVGENGSGKTTLAKLLAGLYLPQTGAIYWDNVDVKDFDSISLGQRISMVLQEPVRWPQSAATNIQIGKHDLGGRIEERRIAAARRSGALSIVEELPEGWDTILSREFAGGQDLSAGQWQRIAVARGLYRDAPLVIWDEPTAPLDAKAELAAYDALREMGQDRTVVLITHRLTSVRNADQIAMMEGGRLVEFGTHAELMAIDGAYAELFHIQENLYELAAL